MKTLFSRFWGWIHHFGEGVKRESSRHKRGIRRERVSEELKRRTRTQERFLIFSTFFKLGFRESYLNIYVLISSWKLNLVFLHTWLCYYFNTYLERDQLRSDLYVIIETGKIFYNTTGNMDTKHKHAWLDTCWRSIRSKARGFHSSLMRLQLLNNTKTLGYCLSLIKSIYLDIVYW